MSPSEPTSRSVAATVAMTVPTADDSGNWKTEMIWKKKLTLVSFSENNQNTLLY